MSHHDKQVRDCFTRTEAKTTNNLKQDSRKLHFERVGKIYLNMEKFSITVIIVFLLIYFFPSIIAFSRSKSNTTAIFMLNLFLGWSFIGWVVALIWAVSKDRESQQIIVNNNAHSEYRIVTPAFIQPIPESIQSNDGMQKTLASRGIKSIEQNSKSHQEKIENLQKLKQLLDDGILTQEEFEQQKKQILG